MILEEHYGSYGTFDPDKNIIAVSDINDYVPFYVGDSYELVTNDVYLYNKPERNVNGRSVKTYPSLLSYLKQSISMRVFKYTLDGVENKLYFMQGYIVDESNNILLILTCKDKSAADKHRYTQEDKELFRLYVSTEFLKNPIYKNFYKKIYKDYIDKFLEEDIEVVYTTSDKIHNSVFKDGFEINYNSLTELTELLHTEPAEILNFNEDSGYIPPIPQDYRGYVDHYINLRETVESLGYASVGISPEINEVRELPPEVSRMGEIIAEMTRSPFYTDPVDNTETVNEPESEDLPF